MDDFLYKMLEMGVSSIATASSDGATGGDNSDSDDAVTFVRPSAEKLVVEQVKIVDTEGTLRVLYPSRTDLNNEAIQVIRQFD